MQQRIHVNITRPLISTQYGSHVDKLSKLVDLGEPISFLDNVYLGCTQRESKSNETMRDECRKMFESRFFCWTN